MKVTVKGVPIELTKQQVKQLEKELAIREKELKNFDSILRHFGFVKLSAKGWANRDAICYVRNDYGWVADIIDYGQYKTCILHGKHIDNRDQWGKQCDSPVVVAEIISQALDEINKE